MKHLNPPRHPSYRHASAFLIPLLFALLTACGFSLAGDVTPPPGYHIPVETAPPTVTLMEVLYPFVPPDPIAGKITYLEECAPCHGENGIGDGPRANEFPNPVTPIGSREVARQASPLDWYRIVTQGELARFMPPFPNLPDRTRWDVVAYSLSLSMSQQKVSQGKEIFKAQCADCHGESGRGDGVKAADMGMIPNFTDQRFMVDKSAADFFQVITEGRSPNMPAFGNVLTEAQRWAVTDYLRWLTFAPSMVAVERQAAPTTTLTGPEAWLAPLATLTPSAEITATATLRSPQPLGVIKGVVTNGSGGDVPSGFTVTLHAYDDFQLVITTTTTLDEEGRFIFQDVELPLGRTFFVTADYEHVTYGSEMVTLEQPVSSLDLPIQIFESTTDASGLSVDRLHLFFEFSDETTLRVIELYVISNTSQETLIAPEKGSPVLKFSLPAGATDLEFDEGLIGERFMLTPDGFGDTLPIQPGSASYQLLFTYRIPYARKLELSHPIPFNTQAVVILVPEEDIRLKGDAIQDMGMRNVQNARYRMYTSGRLPAGSRLNLTITGSPSGRNSLVSSTSRSNLLVGGAALGIAFICLGIWLYRRDKWVGDGKEEVDSGLPLPSQETPEALMDAILALDDLYQDGQIPEEAYRSRRGELKERLKKAMSQ